MDNSKDSLERRCPRLGGPVTFRYCREGGDGELPCWKVIDCWWEYFDVVRFFQRILSEKQFDRLLNVRPESKVGSLVELIKQAKKNCG